MGTRTNIIISGLGQYQNKTTVLFYRHMDGYPTSILPSIKEAYQKAKKEIIDHECTFGKKYTNPMNTSLLAGKIIGAMTDYYGMHAEIEKIEDGLIQENINKLDPLMAGDAEWVYVIDLEKPKSHKLYVYRGQGKEAIERGVVDPEKYADQLKEEYQEDEKLEIRQAVRSLNCIGLKVNPKTPLLPLKKMKKKRRKRKTQLKVV